MVSLVRERNIDEIKNKLLSFNTDLNKLSYLEIAMKESSLSFEVKRFLLEEAVKLYEKRKMFDKAAKAMANKASMEVTLKERIESFLKAAELYARAGRVEYADDVFVKAKREANTQQRSRIELAKKNIYTLFAKELDKQGKKASALKFYEKLIKMQIDPLEKRMIIEKLISIYKSLGMFREAKLVEGFL
jgi:tetratricopeptide (TPR) repeat protein